MLRLCVLYFCLFVLTYVVLYYIYINLKYYYFITFLQFLQRMFTTGNCEPAVWEETFGYRY